MSKLLVSAILLISAVFVTPTAAQRRGGGGGGVVTFAVFVEDSTGKPVADVRVSVEFAPQDTDAWREARSEPPRASCALSAAATAVESCL